VAQKTGILCFVDRFSNVFHSQNKENIYNNTVTKDPTTPQVCAALYLVKF